MLTARRTDKAMIEGIRGEEIRSNNGGRGNGSSSHNDSYQEIALERKSLREISRRQLRMWAFFTFLVNIAIHEIYSYSQLLDDSTISTSSIVATSSMAVIIDDNKTTTKKNTTDNNIIYGHLHIPKTGGTTLNGLMAAKYERVCGNKGYSHDAYQANIRAFEAGKEKFTEKGSGNAWNYISKNIGFEDCDYISEERSWDFWPNIIKILTSASTPSASISEQTNKKQLGLQQQRQQQQQSDGDNNNNLILELHVPCRDPIDHLMSMANYEGRVVKRVVFDCTGVETNDTLLETEIERAYFDMNRFNSQLVSQQKKNNIRLKCFQSIPVKPYIEYMDRFLQSRRIESEYYHHSTNDKRDKAKECVWNLPLEVRNKIRTILMKNHPYMKFCNRCMGTKHQLQFYS